MRLIDIVNGPWSIIPAMLEEIQQVYITHLRGEKIDIKAVEQKLGRPLNNEQKPYQVENGTAVIPIQGVIAKKMNMFSQISGGVSSEQVKKNFQEAMADPEVQKVLLYIDSPGGTVDGTHELADSIFQARGQKPITAYTDGQMCSAAYLIGSAADNRYISSDSTAVGSIGVIGRHVDVSKREETAGIKTTVLTAGKYKGVGHSYAPLSQEHQDIMQGQLDYMYTTFVDTVARNLGISTEKVVADMAEGRLFIGKQAITAGLVDGVSTIEELMQPHSSTSYLTCNPKKMSAEAGVVAADEEQTMNLAEMKEKFPDIYLAIIAEGHTAGAAEGAEAERARIQAISEIPAAGHMDIVTAAMFDGTSTAGDVAQAILKKEKATREGKLADMLADAPDPAAVSEPGEVKEEDLAVAAVVNYMVGYAKQQGRA